MAIQVLHRTDLVMPRKVPDNVGMHSCTSYFLFCLRNRSPVTYLPSPNTGERDRPNLQKTRHIFPSSSDVMSEITKNNAEERYASIRRSSAPSRYRTHLLRLLCSDY